MMDCQAWYGSLLRAQNCFILVAAILYTDGRFRGLGVFGNWCEEVIDGFPFFNQWLHGLGKGIELRHEVVSWLGHCSTAVSARQSCGHVKERKS